MALWDDFLRAVTPRSDAEKQVDALYSPVRTYSANYLSDELSAGAPIPAPYNAPAELSWWDRLKESVVPESYGESIVNDIYGGNTRGIGPDPAYNVNDLSSPNVYVRGKVAVKDAVSALSGALNNRLLLLGGLLIVLVVVYAAVPAFIRR